MYMLFSFEKNPFKVKMKNLRWVRIRLSLYLSVFFTKSRI